jgi:hypothetical protein
MKAAGSAPQVVGHGVPETNRKCINKKRRLAVQTVASAETNAKRRRFCMRRRDFIIFFSGLAANFRDVAMAENDLALVLIGEFSAWFEALSAKDVLPRAFTGVTRDGNQAVVILTNLPLDHVQRRAFLIWLCRNEGFVAYAYGTRVGIADDASSITEGLDIYASSYEYDASRTLGIEKRADGTIRLSETHHAVLPANPENGLFFGLQRSNLIIPAKEEEIFQNLWQDLKSKAMWRQR